MPIQIEVHSAHAQLLADFYINRLKVLRDEILDREKEMKEITQIIQKLRKKGNEAENDVENTVSTKDYSDKWPWVKKIEFAINYRDKSLTTKEIVDTLTEFEPSFIFERKKVVASISSTLSTKSGPGKEFVRVQSNSGEFAYHLKPLEGMAGFEEPDLFDDEPF